MSACPDCPKYGITEKRRAMCCEEMKAGEPSLEETRRRLNEMLAEERAARPQEQYQPMNRAAWRRAAKLAR